MPFATSIHILSLACWIIGIFAEVLKAAISCLVREALPALLARATRTIRQITAPGGHKLATLRFALATIIQMLGEAETLCGTLLVLALILQATVPLCILTTPGTLLALTSIASRQIASSVLVMAPRE